MESIQRLITSGVFDCDNESDDKVDDEKDKVSTFCRLIRAIIQCRFEATETAADELALVRILETLLKALRHRLARRALNDQDVGMMVHTAFSLGKQTRFTDLLRGLADSTALGIVEEIFGRLPVLIEAYHRKPDDFLPLEEEETKPAESTTDPAALQSPRRVSLAHISYPTPRAEDAAGQTMAEGGEEKLTEPIVHAVAVIDQSKSVQVSNTLPPFGLAAAVEIFRFLTRLVDPGEGRNDERTRNVALTAISTIIANPIDGPSIGLMARCEGLFEIVRNDLARHLLLLLFDPMGTHGSSTATMIQVQNLVLLLFGRFRRWLVGEFDFFLWRLLQHLLSSGATVVPAIASAAPATSTIIASSAGFSLQTGRSIREFYLETIILFIMADPDLIGDLWMWHDTSAHMNSLLGTTVQAIHGILKRDQPISRGIGGEIQLCLDLVAQLVGYFEREALHEGNTAVAAATMDPRLLLETRARKETYQQAAQIFNSSGPKAAFAFLQDQGLLERSADFQQKEISSAQTQNYPMQLCQQLRQMPSIDKRILGEWLGKPGNETVLEAFLRSFQFRPNAPIDEALRLVLESFRLPGEAQQISRIMEAFATVYFDALDPSTRPFRSRDAAFVLAYSTIMLNTDQHNPQVRHRMSLEQFIRNNRGINDGEDFSPEYLTALYTAIQTREIVMPEEGKGNSAPAAAAAPASSTQSTSAVAATSQAADGSSIPASKKPSLASSSAALMAGWPGQRKRTDDLCRERSILHLPLPILSISPYLPDMIAFLGPTLIDALGGILAATVGGSSVALAGAASDETFAITFKRALGLLEQLAAISINVRNLEDEDSTQSSSPLAGQAVILAWRATRLGEVSLVHLAQSIHGTGIITHSSFFSHSPSLP